MREKAGKGEDGDMWHECQLGEEEDLIDLND